MIPQPLETSITLADTKRQQDPVPEYLGMMDKDHDDRAAPGSFDGALSDKIYGRAQEQCVNRVSQPTPIQKNAVVVWTRAVGYA